MKVFHANIHIQNGKEEEEKSDAKEYLTNLSPEYPTTANSGGEKKIC